MSRFKLTINTGKYDEDLGYTVGKSRLIDTYKTEGEATEAAKKVTRESMNIPIAEGYTLLVAEYKGKEIIREIERLNTHAHNMTEEQRQLAKKARLKAQGYESVRVIGKPTESEIYYFENGKMVHEQETSVIMTQSSIRGVVHAERPPQKGEKKILRGMIARVGNEYFAKYYDERPWES